VKEKKRKRTATMDGCEILHELKTVVSPSIYSWLVIIWLILMMANILLMVNINGYYMVNDG